MLSKGAKPMPRQGRSEEEKRNEGRHSHGSQLTLQAIGHGIGSSILGHWLQVLSNGVQTAAH